MGRWVEQRRIPCQGTNTVRRGKSGSFPWNPALSLHTRMFLALISSGRGCTFSSPLLLPSGCVRLQPLLSATSPPASRQGTVPATLRGHARHGAGEAWKTIIRRGGKGAQAAVGPAARGQGEGECQPLVPLGRAAAAERGSSHGSWGSGGAAELSFSQERALNKLSS